MHEIEAGVSDENQKQSTETALQGATLAFTSKPSEQRQDVSNKRGSKTIKNNTLVGGREGAARKAALIASTIANNRSTKSQDGEETMRALYAVKAVKDKPQQLIDLDCETVADASSKHEGGSHGSSTRLAAVRSNVTKTGSVGGEDARNSFQLSPSLSMAESPHHIAAKLAVGRSPTVAAAVAGIKSRSSVAPHQKNTTSTRITVSNRLNRTVDRSEPNPKHQGSMTNIPDDADIPRQRQNNERTALATPERRSNNFTTTTKQTGRLKMTASYPPPPDRSNQPTPSSGYTTDLDSQSSEKPPLNRTVVARPPPPPPPPPRLSTTKIGLKEKSPSSTSRLVTQSPATAQFTEPSNLPHISRPIPLRPGDQKALAAVTASSLAISRSPSPTKGTQAPPPPPQRRTTLLKPTFSRSSSSHGIRTRSTSRNNSPNKGTGMKRTMRVAPPPVPDQKDKDSTYRRFRAHPHKHREGDRKKWRNSVTEQERKRYEGVWAANRGLWITEEEQINLKNKSIALQNMVASPVVRDLWNRSKLPNALLEQIWNLVSFDGYALLSKEEFVVGMWLIDQCLKGHKLPAKVSQSVWDSVRTGSAARTSESGPDH
ncbi:Increased rDNA silencing protein [Myotisia sp. PD_48]|nr:Increased rDNA silencing protein [Myotisia sp. PD_48]